VCFYWFCWLLEIIPIPYRGYYCKKVIHRHLDFIISPGKREKNGCTDHEKNLRSILEKQVMCNGNESNNYVKI